MTALDAMISDIEKRCNKGALSEAEAIEILGEIEDSCRGKRDSAALKAHHAINRIMAPCDADGEAIFRSI